jgi:Dihaem cytochrome c
MNSRLLVLLTVPLLLAPLASRADDDDDDEGGKQLSAAAKASPGSKLYAAECGTCHLAFPPSMLPARSWTALLAGLANHFKENAELDLATRKALGAFLTANAGREVAGPTTLRITTLPSWRREHDEVSAAVYARKAILTPANCGACHPGANDGAFGEHQVRIPAAGDPARP